MTKRVGSGQGCWGGLPLKTKKGNVEEMKGLSWISLKSSAPQCEPQPLGAAAKHDITLARLGASNNASKVSLVQLPLVLPCYTLCWLTLHRMFF